MRLRAKQPDSSSVLPADLAAGPASADPAARRAWMAACDQWARANGYAHWRKLLPESVRREYAPTARERYQRMVEEGRA